MSRYLDDLDFTCVVDGRPDLGWSNRGWGTTKAKKFAPYIYSANKNGALVHKVREVTFNWWAGVNHQMVRRKRPLVSAKTVCSQVFFLETGRSVVCQLPSPDSVLCGRCHGTGPVFTKSGSAKEKRAAHDLLGCAQEAVPA